MKLKEPGKRSRATDAILARVERLHAEVDRQAQALERHHAGRLQCGRGCSGCCRDDLTVFEVEAELILSRHDAVVRPGAASPPGACAFLDPQGACRIYADRPYVCRTQGLPLRWLEVGPAGGVVEFRDICPLSDAPERPPEQLSPTECWTIGPVEGRLAGLQREFDGEPLRRIGLRALFDSHSGGGAD